MNKAKTLGAASTLLRHATSAGTGPLAPDAETFRRRNWLWLGTTVAGLVLAPLLPGYTAFIAAQFLTLLMAVHGLNILAGYNGQVSLGNGAFFALGAYVTAIAIKTFGLHFLLAVGLGGALTAAVGAAVAFPALRLGGVYLALATFAAAVAVPQILKFGPLEPLTGGLGGLLLEPLNAPFGLSQDHALLLIALPVASVVLWIGDNLVRGSGGRQVAAVRMNWMAASAAGVDVDRTKILVLTISAWMTGMAGALSAITVQYVSPDSFSFILSVTLLVGVVIGGLGSFTGSLLGATFIQIVPNYVDQVSKTATGAVFGFTLIAVMALMPLGLAGALRKAVTFFRRRAERSLS